MLKNIDVNNHSLDIYILTDQPTTCGICGARTDFDDIDEITQLHKCLNSACGYIFITEYDEEFAKMWSE